MAECYGAQRTGSPGSGMRAAVASAAVHGELNDSPAGGPGSSAAPGSRSHSPQPVAGPERTRQHPGREHKAAVPPAVMPPKAVQCQQGRWARGLECMP